MVMAWSQWTSLPLWAWTKQKYMRKRNCPVKTSRASKMSSSKSFSMRLTLPSSLCPTESTRTIFSGLWITWILVTFRHSPWYLMVWWWRQLSRERWQKRRKHVFWHNLRCPPSWGQRPLHTWASTRPWRLTRSASEIGEIDSRSLMQLLPPAPDVKAGAFRKSFHNISRFVWFNAVKVKIKEKQIQMTQMAHSIIQCWIDALGWCFCSDSPQALPVKRDFQMSQQADLVLDPAECASTITLSRGQREEHSFSGDEHAAVYNDKRKGVVCYCLPFFARGCSLNRLFELSIHVNTFSCSLGQSASAIRTSPRQELWVVNSPIVSTTILNHQFISVLFLGMQWIWILSL